MPSLAMATSCNDEWGSVSHGDGIVRLGGAQSCNGNDP